MRKPYAPLILALAALLAAPEAWAQTMYRSTMPDGRTILSDRPMPGARKVEEIKIPPGNVAPGPAPAAKDKPKPKPKPPAPSRTDALSAAEAELRQAQMAHDAARDAAEKGKEPREGERLGTAGGASRLSDEYWARQKALADAVAAAQKRVDAAQAKLNALR